MAFFDAQFQVQPDDVIAFSVGQRTAVEMQVGLSIANEGTWLYRNLKHPRYKNFYGYAQLMSGAFVVEDIPLTFLNQELVHWRDIAWGINETTVCLAKLLGTGFSPQLVIAGFNVKTRQRFTSIRFRLLPGIVANVTYVWESAQSECNNEVREPDEKQGQPPLPNNAGGSPSSRPGDQGGDPFDSSPNDGGQTPGSGLPNPPAPGGGVVNGSWKTVITGFRQDDTSYSVELDTEIRDPNIVVTFDLIPTVPSSPNDAGKPNQTLVIIAAGNARVTGANGFSLQYSPAYYSQ